MSVRGRSQSFSNCYSESKKVKRDSLSGKQREGLSSSILLQKSSDGKALQGIYLTKRIEDQLQVRGQLLEVPQNDTEATQQTKKIIREFSSAHQEDQYEKIVEVLGHSAAASFSSSIPIYGDVTLGINASKGDETKVLYLSTLKFLTVHLASYNFESADLKLSNNAKVELRNISRMLRVQKADKSHVQEACKKFFRRYGSHANRGPICFGADIRWKCFSKDFDNSEVDSVKKMQNSAISKAGLSFSGVSAATEVSMENIKVNYSTNCSKKTCLNTHLVVTRKGGPLEAANFSKWNEDLVTDNDTWIVTDRGEKLEAVWDIIKRNHRGLGDVIDVLKTTWESVTGLEASSDSPLLKMGLHSLQNALETEAEHCEYTHPQGEPVFSRNKSAHDLFKKLSLSKHYPMGLSQKEALCVRSGPLELSTNPTSFPDIPYLVLHKLMAYDHRCRSDLMPSKSQDNEDEEDSDDNEGCPNDERVHPVDSLLALLICSNNFLLQDLLSRLAKCQLAVPFILPDPFTKQLSIPLWAMHSIIKNWKFINSESKVVEMTCPIISYKMPIISFIRLGKHQERGASKSKLLNDVISESHYDHFFHRDLAGGQSEVLLGKGLVDMCWYLPSGKPKEAFSDAITFLNLHGDARDYPQQSKFLSKISSMFFILLTQKDLKFVGETIKTLKVFSSSFGCITILNDTETSSEELKIEIPEANIIKLTGKNASEVKSSVQKKIKINLKHKKNLKTLEDHCNCDTTAMFIDEYSGSLKVGKLLARGIQDMVSDEVKESSTKGLLPLQGLWQTWASEDKEFYRQVHRGSKLVNIYTREIKGRKQMLRQRQLKCIESLPLMMDVFIRTLLQYGGPSNRIIRNYFLQCLKSGLGDFSRDHISALQQQYQSLRIELREIQKNGTPTIKEQTKKKMNDIKKQLCQASNFFGLEHILRELGQIYEAASELSPISGLSRLTEAAAELLIEGYPLELMDGDAAHVPLSWVTAVITEVAIKLGDPKVFVLSVLGLQSTGKSTMLNAVFGLNFKVSPGRCTRGAFMQLLPLDEQLRIQTSFSYVLIVDTEGLRMAALDPQVAHKHDNELATFVIGLADVTLINIYGEVPGDMDDILQTSVHAFLRMSQVIKYRRSCQFVHQNAEPGENTEIVRENFTNKLNKFTVDAAKEANVEGQYKTFNDVIKFNDTQDIHHFPGLWTGEQPMAHVSQGYSEAAQKLKYHLIEILKESRVGNMPLSSFKHKVSDLWEALLKENFVFSFKNTLEITAYNSLETQYSQWEWEFREAMLKWERTKENEIKTAEPDTVSELVREKCKELDKHIYNLYEYHKSEMESFFNSSKHGEILTKWKARFEIKLDNLSKELQNHAASQCEKLRSSREVISKFEEERNKFTELMTENVQELIESLKQEQEKMHANLMEKKMEPSELAKILDLFTPEYLKEYREEEIITGDQEESLFKILQDYEISMSEQCIMVDEILSTQQVISILNQGRQSQRELEAKFNIIWDVMLNKLPYVTDSRVDVEASVERVLFDCAKSYESYILHKTSLGKSVAAADLKLVVEHSHYTVKEQVTNSSDSYQIKAQRITDEIFEIARSCVDSITFLESDFKPDYTRELLKSLDSEIDKHGSYGFRFTPKYKFDVYSLACSYAVVEFEKMAVSFQKKNNPRLYLEEIKGPLFTRFKNQYYQKKAEEGIANSLCAHFEGPIKIQVRKSLSTTIVGQMKNSGRHFRSKIALKVQVLTDLYHENDFDSYMLYVTNVKRCLEEKLKYYTIQYCDEIEFGLKNTRLQILAREEVTELTQFIEEHVTESMEGETNFSEWLKTFCENVEIRSKLGVTLNVEDITKGYDSESIQELNLNNVKLQIRKGLTNLHGILDRIQCESEMENWKVMPHEFLKELIGCTEQCPFCGEQCDLQDADHDDAVNHRTAVHHSGCLKGYRDVHTQILYTDFCPAKIACKEKFRNETTSQKWVDYSKYQRIYPKWTITPDIASENSLYWMLFIGRYKDQIAERFNAKPPIVPESWSNISWEEIEENLKKLYDLIPFHNN